MSLIDLLAIYDAMKSDLGKMAILDVILTEVELSQAFPIETPRCPHCGLANPNRDSYFCRNCGYWEGMRPNG